MFSMTCSFYYVSDVFLIIVTAYMVICAVMVEFPKVSLLYWLCFRYHRVFIKFAFFLILFYLSLLLRLLWVEMKGNNLPLPQTIY